MIEIQKALWKHRQDRGEQGARNQAAEASRNRWLFLGPLP